MSNSVGNAGVSSSSLTSSDVGVRLRASLRGSSRTESEVLGRRYTDCGPLLEGGAGSRTIRSGLGVSLPGSMIGVAA